MGKILCIGQSAYDITIPLSEPIVENQKYRIYPQQVCIYLPKRRYLWRRSQVPQSSIHNGVCSFPSTQDIKQELEERTLCLLLKSTQFL